MQRDKIRDGLQQKLKRRFTEGLWSYLEDRGYVDDADRQMDPVEFLAREARAIIRATDAGSAGRAQATVETHPPTPKPGSERAWALSTLVAKHAAEDPEVIRFRQAYLPRGLIPWKDCEAWIKRQDADMNPTFDVTLIIPDSDITRDDGEYRLSRSALTCPIRKFESTAVSYTVPGDRWIRHWGASTSGVLAALQQVATSIANSFGWRPAQAVIFILSGATPHIPAVRVSHAQLKTRYNRDLAWATRIELDVDPAATPDEVINAFQGARKELGLTDTRVVPPKLSRLAAFAAVEHADESSKERKRLWNEEFPQWSYSEERNFRRDAIRAKARLLYPGRLRGAAPLRRRPSR